MSQKFVVSANCVAEFSICYEAAKNTIVEVTGHAIKYMEGLGAPKKSNFQKQKFNENLTLN